MIKTIGGDVIGVNLCPRVLMRIPRENPDKNIPPSLLGLVSLRLGVKDSYVWVLVFLRLGISFLTLGG